MVVFSPPAGAFFGADEPHRLEIADAVPCPFRSVIAAFRAMVVIAQLNGARFSGDPAARHMSVSDSISPRSRITSPL